MNNITMKLAFVLSTFLVSLGTFATDKFSQFTCENMKMIGDAPDIMGSTSFVVVAASSAPNNCETLLVFDNHEAAVVKRKILEENQIQNQIVIVSTRHNTIRPIIGRSSQIRNRVSSRSHAEGGGRGGTILPTISEQITLLRIRSLGHQKIGVETFQIRFKLLQSFKTTFNSTQIKKLEKYPLVEFDLCGQRINPDGGTYHSIAEKHASCENYTNKEQDVFEQFWKF
ncbi:MAG: hypothetical protein L3J59_00490 [Methylococcaceae bacterium]|nr:hypothetical protein [Methylococcaceae bacterium]